MNPKGAIKGFIIGLLIGGFMGYLIFTKMGADLDPWSSGVLMIIFPLLMGFYGAVEGNKLK